MALKGDDLVLEAVGLSKRYDNGTEALQETNLSLRRGELCALVGPNGAGKSTLINMLAGAIQPTSGTVAIKDGMRVGWSNQRTTIDWYLNVRQNVYIGPRLYGFSRRESSRITEEILKVLALDSLVETEPDQLSGGQQQRVQVARSIATGASVLLLDEPTVGLDVEAAENVLGHLRQLVKEGSTVLISSHDLGLLESFCDRIVVVVAGEKVADQGMREFLSTHGTAERVTIRFVGTISESTMASLRATFVKVELDEDLTIVSPERMSLADISHALGSDVDVTDIDRDHRSLRDVYRRLYT